MRLILVGFGTVGRGVADCLLAAAPRFKERGIEPRVVGVIDPVVGSVVDERGLDLEALLRCVDDDGRLDALDGVTAISGLDELLSRDIADVLVELTPTNLEHGEPGLTHVRNAIAAGLHVVTTNKGPVALAYRELTAAANAAGVEFRFEGTVMSGTPVLNLYETGLAGAGVRGIRGVLNGTCNFILSQMEAGAGYQQALDEAQARGYAEADPSGDVDGWDAAAKVLILANCVLGADLNIDDVERSGIAAITAAEVESAMADGHTWRLVGRVAERNGDWHGSVGPERVERNDPLGALTGPGNLVVFETDSLGDVAISGPGAGRRATGHAVVADLLALGRDHRS